MRRCSLVLALCLALPSVAHAQWTVAPQAGAMLYDEETGLKAMPLGGVELARAFGSFGLALGLDYARGEVDGTKFPRAQLDFGLDSTVYAVINQPVSAVHYYARGEIGFGSGSLRPYATAGAGGHTLFLDPQQHDAPESVSGALLLAGAGLRIGDPAGASLVVDVRDVVYLGFDPEQLNPVEERFRNDRFPELNPEPLEEGTRHNIRLTLGFSFRPAGGS